MINIYVYGCKGCGLTGIRLRAARKYASKIGEELIIHETKYDRVQEFKQIELLKSIGITDRYENIVEHDGVVSTLKEWN